MRTGVQAKVGVLALLGVGALAAVGASRLGVGSLGDPGPGLWPLIVSLAMVTVAVALVIRPGDDGDEAAEPITRSAYAVVAGALSLVAYSWLFERVGFEIPTVLLLVLWLRVFGHDGWRTTIAVAVGATAAAYLLFIVGLGVSLPHLLVI